jgi:hypothetical protein
MKRCMTFLLLAGSISLAACSSRTIERESSPIVGLRDPSVHFLGDNTRTLPTAGSFDWGFAIFRIADIPELNLADVDKRIHDALLGALTKKGFVKTDTGPDFLVSYALASGAGIDEATLNGAYDGAVHPPPPAIPTNNFNIAGARSSSTSRRRKRHLLWRAIMADVDSASARINVCEPRAPSKNS